MTQVNLTAQPREKVGRRVKSLRRDGFIPCNVYGKSIDSFAVQVKKTGFLPVYKEAGETGVINLTVADKNQPVLVHDIQIHAVSGEILHVDFLAVNLKEKVVAQIPVELEGDSPAEKGGIGTVVLQMDEIEVEALPTDLPEKFVVDISTFTDVDQAIFVSDLQYDKAKVEVKEDPESIIAKVEGLQKEEVVTAPVAEETTTEGKEAVTKEEPKVEESTSETK